MITLGQLVRRNPREVWEHEATSFTPWLRDNISYVADALGLELDLIEREVAVGDFSADIVAKDLNTGRWVIIENQLDSTDHKHLGQILTYAANRKAGVMVWISPEFRDEHRQAVEWLNDVTDENTEFFGLQLEVLQIDDSPMAPNLSIVAKPGEWRRKATKKAEASSKQQAYQAFFDGVLRTLKAKAPHVTSARTASYQSWLSFAAGRSGFQYAFAFTGDSRYRIELYVDTGNADRNKKAFDLLRADEQHIVAELGMPMEWDRIDNKQACRISVYFPQSVQITDGPAKLAEASEWSVDSVLRLREAMTPRIRALSL